ncbi:MAG: adenosylmethionine--8-amino-7-oxononanoate transaminase [Verrucomicrobia bacterium]|jgi:adenosylmethionine---8-amino-7-oxononanoate aminotransferase|nr:adenosylmethionine--8-amino-7-oxononanoate transaminase [Verrucomicrobiota bacterium]
MHRTAQLDHDHLWHPFTQMRDWLKTEPIVIAEGKGAVLRDVHGRDYLDANASIWTNLHGHNHPKINAAIRRQLGRISHSSALGFANEPASLLAEQLIRHANPEGIVRDAKARPLERVFYSDDGSTAMEVALKMAFEVARRKRPGSRPRFLSLGGAYHGDTVGAVSLGHVDLFHKAYQPLLFKTESVMAPACYRCPHNKARAERADARDYRKCQWECVDRVEKKLVVRKQKGDPHAGMVVEPLVQGAAGIVAHPEGWLRRVAGLLKQIDVPLIADEVMTGFGRTGIRDLGNGDPNAGPVLFASHQEGVQPEYLAVAKGLTGGYLPMAATLTTGRVFEAFLGEYGEFKSFFHGHSFTGNQLGSAAALSSLEILTGSASIRRRVRLQKVLESELAALWKLPQVGDLRQVGLIAGIELVRDWRTREAFPLTDRVGIRVCEAMARRGVLTRPVGNVIVLMPPYCTTDEQVAKMVGAVREGIGEVLLKN